MGLCGLQDFFIGTGVNHFAGRKFRNAPYLIHPLDHLAEHRIDSAKLREVFERKEYFRARKTGFIVASHADNAGARGQRLQVRIQFKFIGNQIAAFLVSVRIVTQIHPLPGRNALNRVVIHPAVRGHINQTVHGIRGRFRPKFYDNLCAALKIQLEIGL